MPKPDAIHLSSVQADVIRLEERTNQHEDVLKEIRSDLKSVAEILVQVQLGFATMQEKQAKDSLFIKSFMGVFLSVVTAGIIFVIKSVV